MTNQNSADKVTHLVCREIQAPIVAAMIRGFADEIGFDKAIKIATDVVKKDAAAAGKALAEQFKGNSLSMLAKIVRELWAIDGIMEIDILKESDDELCFDVKRCGYADAYEKLGVKDLGCVLSCCRDFALLDGFNPDIELTRTKTIMEGDDCCDFRYKLKARS